MNRLSAGYHVQGSLRAEWAAILAVYPGGLSPSPGERPAKRAYLIAKPQETGNHRKTHFLLGALSIAQNGLSEILLSST